MGCSAAGQFPGQDKASATPGLAALYGVCSPAQPSGCSPPPGTRCLSPSTGPGHGPQSLTSRNHCSASYRHVQVIWGRRAVPQESGWLICRTLGQNEPGEVQGVGSSLQPRKDEAEQRWALMRPDHGAHRRSDQYWLMLCREVVLTAV